MEKFGLNELREKFLLFFEGKGHLRLPSFSLIPQHDASLLLINAGMSPMKTWFTGEEDPPSPRVCTCQKCIRTGDIENIGKTARHGTYFEMLGNFSFGDYFKKEAIAWGWEFLTSAEWIGIDPDLLYPSVYVEDDEAWNIWHDEIGIASERIFRFGKADNFWEHGAGPCGPCSEIYYDRGEQFGCGSPDCTVGCECDRYIEVWNIVFSEFNNDGKNNYTELTKKNIDTGMGLERLAVVCQGVNSLFDVDTVMNITNKVSEITGAEYEQSREHDVSLRIITDHIRSATFMIGDGVLPSNEGRGYVLRRLLRRAARHGKLLGVHEPFLYRVCATVIEENKTAYTDLPEKEDYITRIIKVEEENFAKTIDAGMKILTDVLTAHKQKHETVFSGADAFKLYDTYGFPIDLTNEIAEEQGLTVDRQKFNQLMEEQRTRAREARAALGDLAWAGIDLGLDNTPTEFNGYERTEDKGRVLAIVLGEELSAKAAKGNKAVIVMDKTPFYAEAGGQIADRGVLDATGGRFMVNDVQKDKAGKYLHYGVVESGVISVEEPVTAKIDLEYRKAVMRAHSATHLLHRALRDVLGKHIEQAGSYVEPDKIRFDFTHFSAISPEELKVIEDKVNEAILEDYSVIIREMDISEAKKQGAIALFSEKYSELVRVVSMGDYSCELCGGTHLKNTAKIGSLRILSEFSIASGVRRIEAITAKLVIEKLRRDSAVIARISETMKTNPNDVESKFEQTMAELKSTRKLVEKLQGQQMKTEADSILQGAKNIKGLTVLAKTITDVPGDELRKLGDMLRDRDEDIVAVLASSHDGKIAVAAACGDGAVKKGVKAGELIKFVSSIAGGSGGGKSERAMGGAKEASKIPTALEAVEGFIEEKLKD